MYKTKNKLVIVLIALIIILSIFVPAKLSQMKDSNFINVIHKQDEEMFPESYKYSLDVKERLYILSMALNTRNILESDYAASLREKAIRTKRDDTAASFAYVENSIGASSSELDSQSAIEICSTKLQTILNDGLGIKDFKVTNNCKVSLYSAVDILKPQRNVSVWQIEYDSIIPPTAEQLLMEAYIDAETGDIYSFAVRTKEPIQFNADNLAKAWAKQLNSISFVDITENNSIIDTTKQYKKYTAEGLNREKIVFSVGYYEGINEIFVLITN